MKKFTSMLVLAFVMSAMYVTAQTRQITGTVLSAEDNSPIIGATVIIAGTSNGDITNENGNYTIKNANGAVTISVQFLGYKEATARVPANATKHDFLLSQDAINIDEVVVTGLGLTRAKKALGYSVQQVEGEELTKVRTGNVVSSLSGRVAGVQITSSSGQLGGGAKINVRGNTSLYGNNQPLFVVDGVPISNQDFSTGSGAGSGYNQGNLASDISPDDIESMSVLKGASATAIYGSRGANGVVLITTKKGKQGKKTFGVSVNSSVTMDKAGIMPEYQKLYGGGAKGALSTITVDGKQYNYPNLSVDESWGAKYDPNVKHLTWNSFDRWDEANYLVEKPWTYPENDYKSYYKTGVSYNNNVQIAGSGESYSYRLSYSNLNQTGITDNSELKRNTISFSGTAKMNKYLDSWVTANYVNTKAVGRQQVGYGDKNPSKTMFQWAQTQLDYNELRAYKNPDGSQRSWNRTAWNNATPQFADNPYWTLNENYESDNRDRFFGNAGINVNIIDGLKLTGRIGVDSWMYSVEERMAEGSAFLSNYTLTNRTSVETNMDLFLTYNKRFADNKIGFSIMGGATSNDRKYGYTGGTTVGGLVVPGIYNLPNSKNKATSYDKKTWQRINALYANATIDWNQIVYLDLTARNDWSSTLPEAHRSYFYPSANLSVIINQIGAMKDLAWLDFAKVRGGYAQVGNDTSPYSLQNYFTIENPFGQDPMFSLGNTLQNPNLRPEKTKSWEVGLEAQFLNRRLGFDIAYYQKNTIDQIIPASVSGATGYLYQYINAGELNNSGLEITINATPIASKSGFRWDMQLNVATLRNKVVSIAPGIDYLQLGSNGFSVYSGAVVGESYPVIYGKNYVYGENGEKLMGTNGKYIKTATDQALGKVTPDFTAGFSNTFTWKGIDVNILFDMQMGGHMYYMSNKYGMYSGIMAETAQQTNVPGKSGDIREDGYIIRDGVYGKNVYNKELNEYVPQYINSDGSNAESGVQNSTALTGQAYSQHFNGGPDAMNVFKSDFIKLREVRIGYTFPARLTGPIKDIRVSAFGRNLATFMVDQKNFDPEYLQMAGSNAQGLEGGYIPTTRSFGFSLGFNF